MYCREPLDYISVSQGMRMTAWCDIEQTWVTQFSSTFLLTIRLQEVCTMIRMTCLDF